MEERSQVLQDLNSFLLSKNAEGFSHYKCNFTLFKCDEEVFDVLGQLFVCDWHQRHEDLATLFQVCKTPIVAKYLYQAALSKYAYLDWNSNLPLQRKCIWALADIGTQEARSYLEKLSNLGNSMIASFATRRLDNWEKEQGRKGKI